MTPHPGPPSRSLWAPLLIVAAALVAMGPATAGGFVYDDEYYVVGNPAVTGAADPWTTPLGDEAQALWRPVTVTTWRWQWPDDAEAFRRVNLWLHVAVSLLLWRLGGRLGLGAAGATLAGVLFAVHPVHAESVAWVTGRAELLAALFVLGAWLAHRWERRGAGLLAAALVVLAGLSKENALVAPALFAAADLGLGRRPRPWARWAGLAAAAVAVAALRFAVLPGWLPGEGPFGHLGLGDRLGVAVGILGGALRLMAWPHPLRIHYHREEFLALDPVALGTCVAAALVIALAWRRQRIVAVALALVPLALLPVLNLVPIGETFAERFLYLPSALVCLAAGALLAALGRGERASGAGLGASVLLVAALLTLAVPAGRAACATFADDLALWSHAAALTPDNPHARYNHGHYLYAAGRVRDGGPGRPGAAGELAASLRLSRAHVYAPFAHHMLGNIALGAVDGGASDPRLAAHHYREALRAKPDLHDAAINLAGLALERPDLIGRDEARRTVTTVLVQPDLTDVQRTAAEGLLGQLLD